MRTGWLAKHQQQTRTSVPYPEYRHDPVGFFRDVLGLFPWDNPTERDGQTDLVDAVGKHKSVTCRSGHKTGKSTSAAGLAWWYWATHEGARVVCTAPTERQVKKVIWRELKRLQRAAIRPLVADVPKDPGTGVLSDDNREIFGFTAVDPDNFSGISGANVLYIVDEASGVAEDIFTALEGNRAGGAKLLMLGNPTQPAGKFYDSHHTSRALFKTLHLDSEDAAIHGAGIPGLATSEWVDEKRVEWGPEDARWDVRVKGDFAKEASNTCIPLWLVERARQRWAETPADGPLVIGVDVAREGDDESVIQPRRGKKLLPRTVVKNADGVQLAGKVAEVARGLLARKEKCRANIDIIGVGAAVYDQLRYNHRDIIDAIAVNVASAGDESEKYHNLRSQLHFMLRDWLKTGGGTLDKDEHLEAELVAPTYKFDNKGRLQVERKEELKKRLNRSPDRADAVMLAVYDKAPARLSVSSRNDNDLPGFRV